MTPLLELHNITKNLRNEFQLHPINLDLYAGEVHVLMGENGSGKSCIMQIVSGMRTADEGTLLYRGKPLQFPDDPKDNPVLYIMQTANILDSLTVAENIFYHNLPLLIPFLKMIDHTRLRRQCLDLIEDLDLPFDVDDSVAHLGFAQRQILGFCRAYVSNAEIIILDEPSAALTDHDRIILHTILQRLKKRGAGIFFISHNLEEIRELGDRITIMKGGHQVGTRILKETSDKEIIRMMSGIMLDDPYPKLPQKMGPEVLRVENLSSSDILKGIDLSLHKGEILGITGLAGSGRTFLARCIYGDHPISSGRMFIHNKEVKIHNPVDAIEQGIALIPEDRFQDALFNQLDLPNNIAITSLKRFSNLSVLDTSLLNCVVKDYVDRINIDHELAWDSIREYSIGEQQKAVLTRWIMKRSRIYILDEITRCLDIPSRIDIYNSMNDLLSRGASLIFISSDINEILGMCDRVLVLSDGQIVCNLPGDRTTREEILAYATGEKH